MNLGTRILAYLKTGRRGKPANRLERDAMHDPFLNDALEGFESIESEDQLLSDIQRMRERLHRKQQPNRRGWIRWAAASVALFLVGGLSYLLLQNNSAKDYMLAEQPPVGKQTAPVQKATPTIEPTDSHSVESAFPERKEAVSDLKIAAESHFEETTLNEVVSSATHSPLHIADNKELIKDRMNEETEASAKHEDEVVIASGLATQKKLTTPPTDSNTKQMIADQTDFYTPRPGKVSGLDATAPQAGKKEILQFSEPAMKVVPRSSESAERREELLADIDKWDDQQTLSEVVVIGYGSRKKNDLTGSISTIKGEELDRAKVKLKIPKALGLVKDEKAHLEELERDLLWFHNQQEKKAKGRLKISFLLDKEGEPYDFKIEKGVDSIYNQEAIRLLEKSGPWTADTLQQDKRIELQVKFAR